MIPITFANVSALPSLDVRHTEVMRRRDRRAAAIVSATLRLARGQVRAGRAAKQNMRIAGFSMKNTGDLFDHFDAGFGMKAWCR